MTEEDGIDLRSKGETLCLKITRVCTSVSL